MNREILFKGFHSCENGKDKVYINGEWINGKWIEGFISGLHVYGTDDKTGDITHIYSYYMNSVHPVIASTVGQYTGLTDKNNKKIFEGDIVMHIQKYDISGVVASVGIVRWSNSYGSWVITDFDNGRADMFLGNEAHRTEVIGNIHNNPELLEAAE